MIVFNEDTIRIHSEEFYDGYTDYERDSVYVSLDNEATWIRVTFEGVDCNNTAEFVFLINSNEFWLETETDLDWNIHDISDIDKKELVNEILKTLDMKGEYNIVIRKLAEAIREAFLE